MNNQLWGPITWTFFHVLVERIKEDSMPYIKHIIIHIITIICNSLPCPTCREHSSKLLANYKHYDVLNSKSQVKQWIFDLHNIVNTKLNKPTLSIDCLEKYKDYSFTEIYYQWNKHFMIVNHDLQLLIDKQKIARTKNTVDKLLSVHSHHFT